MNVLNLHKENIPEVVTVLCEAFYNYPVMKYVLGEKQDYDSRLRKLVTFFVSARALRSEPIIGIYNQEKKLIAAAVVTLRGDIPIPEELKRMRENLWKELGNEEEVRYERYGSAASGLLPKEPHHHLNMIGVSNTYRGKGLARQLIHQVEILVSEDPTSIGLSLNTEVEASVNFYLHLGFELIGKAIVEKNVLPQAITDDSMTETSSHNTTVTSSSDIVTWGFFKSR